MADEWAVFHGVSLNMNTDDRRGFFPLLFFDNK